MVVCLGITVNVFNKKLLLPDAQTGNMLHQLFMFFVSFLPDGKSGHHCSQRRGHRTVKSSHTAASGYRITTGYFI